MATLSLKDFCVTLRLSTASVCDHRVGRHDESGKRHAQLLPNASLVLQEPAIRALDPLH